MEITSEQARRVAELARLRLDEAELPRLAAEMSALIAYFDQLQQLDTADVEPTTHVVPFSCPLREDRARPSLPREELLAPAPASHGGEFFVVPPVLG